MDILVFFEESVLVVRLLQPVILRAHTPDCSFHLLLHILNLVCRFYQLLSSPFDLYKIRLRRSFLITVNFMVEGCLFVVFIHQKCLHVRLELF